MRAQVPGPAAGAHVSPGWQSSPISHAYPFPVQLPNGTGGGTHVSFVPWQSPGELHTRALAEQWLCCSRSTHTALPPPQSTLVVHAFGTREPRLAANGTNAISYR